MGLIGNILGAFGKKTATSVVQGLVNLDPDTASDVQVRQYGDMVEQRAQFVVNSQTRMNSVQENSILKINVSMQLRKVLPIYYPRSKRMKLNSPLTRVLQKLSS